ncbi:putative prophage CPS-53 integrase [compost metagenome]
MQKRLYIEVRPTGKKIWRFKYTFNGKEGTISFGEYPIVSLAEARKKKDESRALLKDDIKPCKYGQFSLQRIRSVIHKSLGIYFIKFRWISRLIQSIQMGLMTQNNTVRSLQIGKRMQ